MYRYFIYFVLERLSDLFLFFCFFVIYLFFFVGKPILFFFFFWEQLKFWVAGVKINETVLQQTRKSISISLENILLSKTNSYLWQEVGGKFRPYSNITGVCLCCKEQNKWKRHYEKYKSFSFSSCLLHIYIYIYWKE